MMMYWQKLPVPLYNYLRGGKRKMKKVRNFAALLLAFVIAVPTMVFGFENRTETDIRLFIEGAEVSTGERGNEPFNIDGRVFLPIRALTTAFAREVHWEPTSSNLHFGTRYNALNHYNLVVTMGGYSEFTDLNFIETLSPQAFQVDDRGNTRNFEGVPLSTVLDIFTFDMSDAYGFAFIAADGMSTIATTEDVMEHGWLVIGEEGERFTSRYAGGRGPFMVVFAEDGVPGRWARMLVEIQVINQPGEYISERLIQVLADGVNVDFADGNGNSATPFMLDGVIYLPVRALSVALGMTVNWNASENAIYVGATPQTFDVAEGGYLVVNAGGHRMVVTMDDILEIGVVDTYAVIRGERRDYSGVPIISIVEFLGFDVSYATGQVTFGSRDGHGTSATPAEAFDPTNGFIVIAENGELLGHWEAGGRGPFMVIFAQDVFAQRFIRYLTDISVEGVPSPAGGGVDDRWNNHPLSIVIGGLSLNLTASVIYAIGASDLEWNNQNFVAVPMASIIEHFSLGEVAGGRIVADNGTEHNITPEDIENMYIAIYQAGHEPATDNHFTTVFVEDTNNQRRMRGLATIYIDAEVQAGYPLNIEIAGRTYGVTVELLQELGAEAVTARDRNWTGTPMTAIIEHFDINLDGIAEGVVISGGTGFTQPFTIEELLDETNFFLAFEEDGVALEIQEGTNSNIMSLFAHDERATRGVRGVVTVRLMAEDAGADVSTTVEGLEDGEFVILRGEDTWTITMDDLVEIGLEDFVTNIPTGGGSTRYFTGVRLSAILESQNIRLDGATNFITTSWESTFSAGWNIATDLDYIFIAVAEDGEVLSPHNGPFFGVVQHRGSNFNPRNLQSIRIN